MKKIKAVVIDDEYLNRDLIASLVVKLNDNYVILGQAEGLEDGYEIISSIEPDVVFLDIKMNDGTGFDLLKQFPDPTFEVVFITGFDEYAIKAFEFNAMDYILKPIDSTKLCKTLARVQSRIFSKEILSTSLKDVVLQYNEGSLISKIPVHYKDKVHLLNINDIISIQTHEGYTMFTASSDQTKYISAKQLSDYEFIVNSFPNFVRVNKSSYVNINFVKNYTKGQVCEVTLSNATTFEVSRRKKSEILEILDRNISG
ncbi:MAG: LytTR family DNA-binding domain-containing protein [Bacteroidota bacterium]